MSKEIVIGNSTYSINYNQESADKIMNLVIEWMERHYAASCWESIAQNDDCIIDAPDLIGFIVDNVLKPEFIK